MSYQSEGNNQQPTTLKDVFKREESKEGQLQSLQFPFLPSEEDSSLGNETLDLVTGGGDSKKDTKLGAGIGAGVGATVGGLIGPYIALVSGCKKRVAVPASMGVVGSLGTVAGVVAGAGKDQKRASKRT